MMQEPNGDDLDTDKRVNLIEQLFTKIPRENSGASSANRFQFQLDWALSKTLELYEEKAEFIIILDFHDDILIIDSERNPTKADFYQVKTKDRGMWNLRSVIGITKGKKNSILGKMFHNKLQFPDADVSINMVSNAMFEFKLAGEEKKDTIGYKEICTNQLCPSVTDKIAKSLMSEFSLTEEPVFKDVVYFRVTELSLADHQTHVKGKIADSFERIDSQLKISAPIVYRLLNDQFRKKNNCEWKFSTVQDVIAYKGFTSSEFKSLIDDIVRNSRVHEEWGSISSDLRKTGLNLKEIKALRNAWIAYDVDRMDSGNCILTEMKKQVLEILEELEPVDYLELVTKGYAMYKSKVNGFHGHVDENYIKAMFLLEFAYAK